MKKMEINETKDNILYLSMTKYFDSFSSVQRSNILLFIVEYCLSNKMSFMNSKTNNQFSIIIKRNNSVFHSQITIDHWTINIYHDTNIDQLIISSFVPDIHSPVSIVIDKMINIHGNNTEMYQIKYNVDNLYIMDNNGSICLCRK